MLMGDHMRDHMKIEVVLKFYFENLKFFNSFAVVFKDKWVLTIPSLFCILFVLLLILLEKLFLNLFSLCF